jgi:hypothetical protein
MRYDPIRGKASAKTAVLSGFDSPEDFPEFQSKELKGLTSLIRDYIEKENTMWFNSEVDRKSGEGDFSLDGSDYFSDEEAKSVNTDLKNSADISQFLDWGLTSTKAGKFGAQKLAYPQERMALIDNYDSEESTSPEELVAKSTINTVSDKEVDKSWSTLSNSKKKWFETAGHGRGGSHPYWKENPEEWGKAMLKRYLEQGGRDGYLHFEGAPPLQFKDMAADHVISYADNTDYWKKKALEEDPNLQGSELAERAKRISDDPSNIIFTRWGFNQQQKDKNPLWDVRQRYEKESKQGASKQDNKAQESQNKKRRGELRNELYWKPLQEAIGEITKRDKSGNMKLTREGYDELRNYAKTGYQMLDKSGYGRDLSKSAGFYQRNAMTDAYRALIGSIKPGIQIFGRDRLRGGDGQQASDWQGIDGKHSNTAADGNIDQGSMVDPGTDYVKHAMAQLHLFGGDKGRLLAKESMDRIKRAGDALVVGDIGTGMFTKYIADNLSAMKQLSDEGGLELDYDDESGDHQRILNANIIKNVLKEKNPSGYRLEEDISNEDRPAMRGNIAKKRNDEEFTRLNEDLRALMNPGEWDEIYKDTVLEQFEYDGELML